MHFGHYRLERPIGRGGMGQVWLAYDTVIEREVALKLLRADVVTDERYRTRFEKEARIVASLREPHIVPVHSFGTVGDRFYIDMALIDGTDLNTILRRDGGLEARQAVEIIEQVAAALDAAHQAGVVHRDVKPANILIHPSGFVYLIDFGIAQPDSYSTNAAEVIGTLSYLAPERLRGESGVPSDVYSLACVLFECLTGKRPFGATDRDEQVRAHLTEPPPRPSQTRSSVSTAFDAVIARGMAKQPEDRYPSAKALAEAARAALPSDYQAEAAVARAHRRRTLLIGGAAVLVVGVLVSAAGVGLLGDMPVGPGSSRTTVTVGTDASDVALDPAQHRAFITNSSEGVLTVVDTESSTVTGTVLVGKEPAAVAVNPSTHAVYVANSADGTIAVVDPATWSVTATVPVGSHPVDIAIDVEANTAYVANLDSNSVSVVDLSNNTVRKTVEVGPEPRCLAFDPERSAIYVSNSGASTVTVIETATGGATSTIDVGRPVWCLAADPIQTTVYVTNPDDHMVSVIRVHENAAAAEIAVGKAPRAVAVNVESHRAYVADYASGAVTVIDTTTDAVASTIDVGAAPTSVAVDSTTGTVYVLADGKLVGVG
ncbi:MAG: serine/threonine-protein kinase [Nocardiaceae bacterium]|nr:serine/threonine-protein kinase [Nocardiaceae bacterium]